MQQKFVRPFDAKDAGAHSSQPCDAAAELRLRSIKPLSLGYPRDQIHCLVTQQLPAENQIEEFAYQRERQQ